MSTTEPPRQCTDCKRPYRDGEQPSCPCGSSRVTHLQNLTAHVTARASLAGIHRSPGYPRGWITKFVERTKLSAFGKLARESLRLDRSEPDKTVKVHRSKSSARTARRKLFTTSASSTRPSAAPNPIRSDELPHDCPIAPTWLTKHLQPGS